MSPGFQLLSMPGSFGPCSLRIAKLRSRHRLRSRAQSQLGVVDLSAHHYAFPVVPTKARQPSLMCAKIPAVGRRPIIVAIPLGTR